ncbi:MAG TPA: hypothetical protein VN207_07640 [Ktedonobacteraceae bacterium]|nr:hypothetical protein [Ktedonobacteraceae bacterium]
MSDTEEQIVRDLPIEWVIPDTLLTSRVTNITIQYSGSTEFIVSFFEQRLPPFAGLLEEQLEQFKKLEAISTVCTARLVLDYQRLVEFSDVFKATVEDIQQKIQKKKGA